jgi:hypothetical protein
VRHCPKQPLTHSHLHEIQSKDRPSRSGEVTKTAGAV